MQANPRSLGSRNGKGPTSTILSCFVGPMIGGSSPQCWISVPLWWGRALAAQRDLGQRCRPDHRAEIESLASRQLHRANIHQGPVQDRTVQRFGQLHEPVVSDSGSDSVTAKSWLGGPKSLPHPPRESQLAVAELHEPRLAAVAAADCSTARMLAGTGNAGAVGAATERAAAEMLLDGQHLKYRGEQATEQDSGGHAGDKHVKPAAPEIHGPAVCRSCRIPVPCSPAFSTSSTAARAQRK